MQEAMAQISNRFQFQKTADYEDIFTSNTTANTTTNVNSVIECASKVTGELMKMRRWILRTQNKIE
jgi:hypothetical protein